MVKVAPSSSESSSSCLRRLLPLGFDKAGEANVVSGLVRKRAIGDMAILLPWEEFVASLEAGTAAISRGFRRFFSPVILFRLTYTEYSYRMVWRIAMHSQRLPLLKLWKWKRGNVETHATRKSIYLRVLSYFGDFAHK